MPKRLRQIDRDALERAIQICRWKSPADREQIERKLKSERRKDVGEFASYSCQCNALQLRPWQDPPCWVELSEIEKIIADGDDGAAGDFAAALLLRKMLHRGISRFEPDPLTALETGPHGIAASGRRRRRCPTSSAAPTSNRSRPD